MLTPARQTGETKMTNSANTTYATDGKCHNANNGTYGHECGKPATWIGIFRSGFRAGFCGDCKAHGDEGIRCIGWEKIIP